MLIIPLQATPAQSVMTQVAGVTLQIDLRQQFYGLFATIWKENALVVAGVRCQDRNRLIRDAYHGFPGDLAFIDNYGETDPVWTGLGERYSLAFIELADIA